MIKNKKAMIFTLLAMALLALFLASYGFYTISKDRKSINKRIDTMNNFVYSVEQDLPRKLFISGFRTIFLFEKKITESGNYITDLNSTFQELFYNGTISGVYQELMEGVTFSGIVSSINEKAREINVNVSLLNPNVTITQEDPWNVKIVLEANLFVKDKGDLALWNRTIILESFVPITNFEDPLYLVNTNGLVVNKINKTIHTDFVSGSDVTNLLDHYTNSYYINISLGPSFLDRLEGKTSSNINGIESLVYLPELAAQGVPIKSKTVVDHIYFTNNDPTSYQIQGMPSEFRIDDDHLSVYEVSGLTS